MLVETKNRTLEETAALFDNKDLAKEVIMILQLLVASCVVEVEPINLESGFAPRLTPLFRNTW